MLTHPTLDLLHGLGLHGMAQGYATLQANAEARSLDHAERRGIILEHEKTLREQKRFETRARAAHLRPGPRERGPGPAKAHNIAVEDAHTRAGQYQQQYQ